MASKIIDKLNRENMNKGKMVSFAVGDTVKVNVKVREGDKERVQAYSGTVIARDGGGGATATFTVRRISHGVGVERVFPVHSPYIASIEVQAASGVRRAKLYYLRKVSSRKTRLQGKKKEAEQEASESVAQV